MTPQDIKFKKNSDQAGMKKRGYRIEGRQLPPP